MRAKWAERGDTFFTHTQSMLGQLIRREQTALDSGEPAWANHVGVVVESGWIGEPAGGTLVKAVVIEALWRVRKGELKTNGVEVRIFRPVPSYTTEEMERFTAAAEEAVGRRYGWWKLLLILGKRLTGIPFEKLFFVKGRPICSTLAGGVNEAARARGAEIDLEKWAYPWPGFGDDPMELTPDDMMDFVLTHPTWWEEVA